VRLEIEVSENMTVFTLFALLNAAGYELVIVAPLSRFRLPVLVQVVKAPRSISGATSPR